MSAKPNHLRASMEIDERRTSATVCGCTICHMYRPMVAMLKAMPTTPCCRRSANDIIWVMFA